MVEYSRKALMILVLGVFATTIIYAYAASIGPNDIAGFNWVNSTVGMDTPNTYVRGTNVTALSLYPQQPASYIIWKSGSTYYAKNGTTGAIDYSGADATTVIESAINSTYSSGLGSILIKRGDYSISTPIDVYGSIWVRGEGMFTQLNLANGADCNIFQWVGGVNQFWFTLSDMYLDGNRANNALGSGLYIDPSAGTFSDWRVRDVAFMYFSEHGIYSTDGWQSYIHGCIAEHCDVTGMRFLGGSIYIDESAFLFNHLGLYLSSGSYFSVQSCKFHHQNTNGISLDSTCDNSMVSDCYFTGNGQSAANTYRGIFVDRYADNNAIIGCTFNGETQEREGVYIESPAANTIISDCHFMNHVTAAITDLSGNTRISQNVGFVTENTGNATLAAVTSSIVVNHGCAYTPTLGDIQVTPSRDLGNCTYYWYDTITATQFTIHVGAGGATRNIDKTVYFLWSVYRH